MRRRTRPTPPGPSVLIDGLRVVHAEAVGNALAAAGFDVYVGSDRGAMRAYDAVILGPEGTEYDAPIILQVGDGSRVLVRQGSETGMMSADGPGDLIRILQTLLADPFGRASPAQA